MEQQVTVSVSEEFTATISAKGVSVSEEFTATISAKGTDWREVIGVAHQYLQSNPRVRVLAMTTSDGRYGMEGQHVPTSKRELELRLLLPQPQDAAQAPEEEEV